MIPVTFPILEGELYTGYLMRLALANGCRTLSEFEKHYMRDEPGGGVHGVVYPDNANAASLLKTEESLLPDAETILRHTPYYADAANLSYKDAARLSENILWDGAAPAVAGKEKKPLKLCPVCMQEDIASYGFPIFRTMHHADGVHVCVIHGAALLHSEKNDRFRRIKVMTENIKMPYQITDMNAEMETAGNAAKLMMDAKNPFITATCPDCGKPYIIHPYSLKTGIPCPYCGDHRSERAVDNRLKAASKGRYELVKGSFAGGGWKGAKARCVRCGHIRGHVSEIIYGKETSCDGCRLLTPGRLQDKYDPEMTEWQFLPADEADRKKKRITVMHLACGHKTTQFAQIFATRGGYCPWCDSGTRMSNIEKVDPEYEMLPGYKNNRTATRIRHKTCGSVFNCSKTAFLAGRRCPVCSVRLSFENVEKTVASCAPSYSVRKSSKRGYAAVYENSARVGTFAYRRIVSDLMAVAPSIFVHRTRQGHMSAGKRKTIYDSIQEATRQKGYWEFQDGIEGQAVDRVTRNLIQDMAKTSQIIRITRGRYKIPERNAV